jgi:hypothetical protein
MTFVPRGPRPLEWTPPPPLMSWSVAQLLALALFWVVCLSAINTLNTLTLAADTGAALSVFERSTPQTVGDHPSALSTTSRVSHGLERSRVLVRSSGRGVWSQGSAKRTLRPSSKTSSGGVAPEEVVSARAWALVLVGLGRCVTSLSLSLNQTRQRDLRDVALSSPCAGPRAPPTPLT